MKQMVMVVVSLSLVSGVFAANPADLTFPFKHGPAPFYRAVYEEDSWFGLVKLPVAEKASVTWTNWHFPRTNTGRDELVYSQKLSTTLESDLAINLNHGRSETTDSFLVLDYSRGRLGLGMLLSLESGKGLLGSRFTLGNLTGFLTLGKGKPSAGVSYANQVCMDVAYSSRTWFVRTSKPGKKVIPELRTRFTPDDTFIGIGVGYCPSSD